MEDDFIKTPIEYSRINVAIVVSRGNTEIVFKICTRVRIIANEKIFVLFGSCLGYHREILSKNLYFD